VVLNSSLQQGSVAKSLKCDELFNRHHCKAVFLKFAQ